MHYIQVICVSISLNTGHVHRCRAILTSWRRQRAPHYAMSFSHSQYYWYCSRVSVLIVETQAVLDLKLFSQRLQDIRMSNDVVAIFSDSFGASLNRSNECISAHLESNPSSLWCSEWEYWPYLDPLLPFSTKKEAWRKNSDFSIYGITDSPFKVNFRALKSYTILFYVKFK